MTCMIIAGEDERTVQLSCDHGTLTASDTGPRWTEDELLDFAYRSLSARTRCLCHLDEHMWRVRPEVPDHVEVSELRVYQDEEEHDDIERERPKRIPPWAVSKAAERVFETRTPSDDHGLAADRRLVRWWYVHGTESE